MDPHSPEQSVELSHLPPTLHSPTRPATKPSTHARTDSRSSRNSLVLTIDTDSFPLLSDTTTLLNPDDNLDELDTAQQMGKKASAPDDSSNGHATGAMAASLLEHRRKHATDPTNGDAASRSSATASLISRSSFNLDDPIPALPGDAGASSKSKGFNELPEKDRRNFLLLVLLYFLQGLPMGLAMGSVSFLLKEHVSYAQMGVFSLAGYPYSMKLLWSPIVDSVWSPKLGRRKSWILPIQALSGLAMLWLGAHAEDMMNHAGGNDGANVWGFTWWWFGLVFMCATQDIAVDGMLRLIRNLSDANIFRLGSHSSVDGERIIRFNCPNCGFDSRTVFDVYSISGI